ncbi:chitin elicitor receptor kinase 1 isoform X2 [Cryptomeria japonica]|uniref:chitin elicitor receptor kinase 1 isoform X2 n=1 Tax=Cryptomeria japonica TaxID=3369 RepID=UPI0025ACFC9C|nr:chitin elicitor receptor kinase 1 isoform X2 [Cryptomeria japonica]
MGIWWRRLCIWFMAAISLSSMDGWIGKAGFAHADCFPRQGCEMALVSYMIAKGDTLNGVSRLFRTTLEKLEAINGISNPDIIPENKYIYIPIPCMCLGDQLGFNLLYEVEFDNVDLGDIVTKFHNLSKAEWIISATPINDPGILFAGFVIKIPLNCSCGRPDISVNGPFVTYVTEGSDGLQSIRSHFNYKASDKLVESLNPSVNWRNRTLHEIVFLPAGTGLPSAFSGQSSMSVMSGSLPVVVSDITGEKSVEFSYDELALATNNFNLDHKIGEGGYGSVYYGILHGQKVAIKKMNLQGTNEFLAELKVLTHVHHTNLVQLIGFCTRDSLFLIYEFVERGTLSQHLHGSGFPTLSWPVRVQIALDAARGLEYIHEHTKPTYIHRDVKTSNILIDKQYRAKVADFGLTKLTGSVLGSISFTFPTKLVGTFGYMSPEYARFGDVSPKVDVYSFGVVLFEIISAREAIIRNTSTSNSSSQQDEQMGLVTWFDRVIKESGSKDKLRNVVDSALEGDYPIDEVEKMIQLAVACTQENPELRPTMRTVVVALMTLLSSKNEGSSSPIFQNLKP